MVNIPGFTYPVQEFLLEDVLELTRYIQTNDLFLVLKCATQTKPNCLSMY